MKCQCTEITSTETATVAGETELQFHSVPEYRLWHYTSDARCQYMADHRHHPFPAVKADVPEGF